AGEDGAIASSLVQTYLRLFEAATSSSSSSARDGDKRKFKHKTKKAAADANASFYAGNAGARLLSALLTGVNRARPYLPPGDPGVEGRTASLFRVVHTGGFSTATQALSLLFQVRAEGSGCCGGCRGGGGGEGNNIAARFYAALYAKLLSPDLRGASNPVLFLNLVYKAIKADRESARAAAFAKRLLQVTRPRQQ
ncbi:unnamed protein product, partial [Hapterophycus canaliculatus]